MSVVCAFEAMRNGGAEPISPCSTMRMSPCSPIPETVDPLSETGLNTQTIVGDAMEQVEPAIAR
eukprot:2834438-Amphidinium_carterae.1